MKTLMILGAGIYQLPLIETAKRMGLRTITVSPPGNYPGIATADAWFNFDTRDYEGILAIARQEKIAGICTSGTDVAIKSLGYVCDQLELPGVSFEAACKATDKMLMKRAFRENGVNTATFRIAHSLQEAHEAAKAIGYPVMIKSTDSSGSRGISKVEHSAQLPSAYQESHDITRNDYVIVEKYIQGDEIGVDGFVGHDGVPKIVLPHLKYVRNTDHAAVPCGHRFPLDYPPSALNAIDTEVRKAAAALGLRDCAFNSDVLINNEGIHIIEMGARTGATCIPELISIHKGYNWYEQIIRASIGEDTEFDSDCFKPSMAKLLFSSRNAVIKAVDYKALELLQNDKVSIKLDIKPGDQVHRLINGTNRFGQVVYAGSDESELDHIIENVMSCIAFE